MKSDNNPTKLGLIEPMPTLCHTIFELPPTFAFNKKIIKNGNLPGTKNQTSNKSNSETKRQVSLGLGPTTLR